MGEFKIGEKNKEHRRGTTEMKVLSIKKLIRSKGQGPLVIRARHRL